MQEGYPDETGKGLTDGKYASMSFVDNAWLSYLGNSEIVIDLGANVDHISAFMLSTLGGGAGAGIMAPAAMTAYISDDGVNYIAVASEHYPMEEKTNASIRIER